MAVRVRAAVVTVVALVVALVGATPGSASPGAGSAAAGPAAGTTSVGSLAVHRCDLGVAPAAAWCGSTRLPLDWADPSGPRITVGFGWVPASGRSVGTVLAMEGGPGYPSTGSAPDFLAMLGPLHADHDLLLVDARGTGRSTPMDCAPLQAYGGSTATDRFRALVRACADQLDHTWKRSDGTWVQAHDLFTTASTARDVAAVVTAMRLGRVDLYGDSYGSWFAQVFMARYPGLLRSVTVDSTYEVRDLDPWYLTSVATARTAFDTACARSLACPAEAPGSVWARLSALAVHLRAHPASGWTTGTDAAPLHVTVDVRALVDMVNDAGYDYAQYRTLDAAGRALLDHGDPAPLMRQYAQDLGWDLSDYTGTPATYYSDGVYYAVACTDYPQLFSMTATPAQRRVQLAAAEAALPAGTFAPFTPAEWVQVDQYTEAYTACLDWPAPVHHDPPLPSPTAPLDPGGVPVLVLNGDLDSLTPAPGGAHVAAQVGPAARALVAANMVHLVALDDRYGCGSSLYQRFVGDPSRLHSMDASCLPAIPEVHTIGSYPRIESEVVPAAVASGTATLRERRLAAVAVAVVGDAAFRYGYVDAYADRGLRGGSTGYRPGPAGTWVRATFRHYRWVDGVGVSGVASVRADGLAAHGTVTVSDGLGAPVVVTVRWATTGPHAIATAQVGAAALRLAAP